MRQFEVIIESSSACQIWEQAFHCIPENYVFSMYFWMGKTCFKLHTVRRLSILNQTWKDHMTVRFGLLDEIKCYCIFDFPVKCCNNCNRKWLSVLGCLQPGIFQMIDMENWQKFKIIGRWTVELTCRWTDQPPPGRDKYFL